MHAAHKLDPALPSAAITTPEAATPNANRRLTAHTLTPDNSALLALSQPLASAHGNFMLGAPGRLPVIVSNVSEVRIEAHRQSPSERPGAGTSPAPLPPTQPASASAPVESLGGGMSISRSGPPGGVPIALASLALLAAWQSLPRFASPRPVGITLPSLAPPG
jgi:hypothetical protein